MVTETDKAYFAGIIDADGSVGIYVKRSGTGYGSHQLTLTLSMSDIQAVEMMSECYGLKTHISRGRNNSKDRLTFSVHGETAAGILRDMVPYMRVKKAHAELGIAFHESRTSWLRNNNKGWGAGRRALTDEEWSKREAFRMQIYAINSSRLGAVPHVRAVAETEWSASTRFPKSNGREATVRTP